MPHAPSNRDPYWRHALQLAFLTIFYNLVEGGVSVAFGARDETLTLLGFGIDSFIEVASGIGILAMVVRIRRDPDTPRSRFERTALRITGSSFYVLAAGLAATAAFNLVTNHRPETTLPGIVISSISIAAMWLLVLAKRKVGRALASAPLLADANCTLVCVYMSIVLLVSSLVYAVTGFGFTDVLGAAGLIVLSVREGRESFEKASGLDCGCSVKE
jgi:divalent metal cation (Fe/Co/Zn/Cd) transporter